jgi:Tfp pilus assembly protein PilF
MMQRKTTQARADFEAATRLDPKTPSAWLGLARIDQLAGKFTAAAANLEKAITHAPNIPVVLNFSAWLHATAPIAAARDGKKAVARALKACELTEWREFGYVDTLAAAYAEVGDFDKAVDFQWYALSLIEGEDEHPNRAEAEERLALFQRREKYREAKPRDDARPGSPPKKDGPDATPTPPLSRPSGGRVGMSSPQLQRSGDRADSGRALLPSCA